MKVHVTVGLSLLFVTALTIGCSSGTESDRVAELEQQLEDAKQQLAETGQEGNAQSEQPSSAETASQATAAPSGASLASPAPRPPASQAGRSSAAPAKESVQTRAAAAAAEEAKAAADRQLAEQKRLNAMQAEENARLRQEIDTLKPREFTVPTGTPLAVRTPRELSTANLSDGSVFDALLENDLVVDGTVLAKAGSRVSGVVVSSDPGGRVKGVAALTVTVRSIAAEDTTIAVTTDDYSVSAESTAKRDAVRTGVATGIGAVIGGIAGGGSGAAIGAGAGAAAGVGANMATRGAAAVIPAETLITFKLAEPSKVVVRP